jgi:DNA adenine methylase
MEPDLTYSLAAPVTMRSIVQPSLFELPEGVQAGEIVNVASVPQRSPFRYPGGKTWLIPIVRRWLRHVGECRLVEPFAGGGIVSLTAVFEGLSVHSTLVERDPDVAAVWKTVLNGKASWLTQRIHDFDVNLSTVRELLRTDPASTQERAFATILKNRVQRGGIVAPGAGLTKVGEKGKGLKSRWYPETLGRRITAIAAMRDKFTFVEGDGLETLRTMRTIRQTAFFIDPPYLQAGRRLYAFSELDHEELFRISSQLACNALLTYDDCDAISRLAGRFGFDVRRIPMKSTHHVRKHELLIAKNLEWLDRAGPSF